MEKSRAKAKEANRQKEATRRCSLEEEEKAMAILVEE